MRCRHCRGPGEQSLCVIRIRTFRVTLEAYRRSSLAHGATLATLGIAPPGKKEVLSVLSFVSCYPREERCALRWRWSHFCIRGCGSNALGFPSQLQAPVSDRLRDHHETGESKPTLQTVRNGTFSLLGTFTERLQRCVVMLPIQLPNDTTQNVSEPADKRQTNVPVHRLEHQDTSSALNALAVRTVSRD